MHSAAARGAHYSRTSTKNTVSTLMGERCEFVNCVRTLQHTATHTATNTATHYSRPTTKKTVSTLITKRVQAMSTRDVRLVNCARTLKHSATRTATHCNTRCNTLQRRGLRHDVAVDTHKVVDRR